MASVYIYQADIYCSPCGEGIRRHLDMEGKTPEFPDRESTYDSDSYPKGPYADGGGEADSPQHCGRCGVFLCNPLTPDGESYVLDKLADGTGNPDVLAEWAEFYNLRRAA